MRCRDHLVPGGCQPGRVRLSGERAGNRTKGWASSHGQGIFGAAERTGRRVLTFDNAGVGGSTGTTPDTIEQMARDAVAFLAAMEFSQADLLGFSIGSFVAQQIALTRPAIVRRLVLASSAPQGAAGMHGWAPEVIGAIGTADPSPEGYLDVFFTRSAPSTCRCSWRMATATR